MTQPFFPLSRTTVAIALAAAALAACSSSDNNNNNNTPTAPVAVGDTVVLTASNRLVSFNRATPSSAVGSVGLRGLGGNERLLGIDFRPATGKLYAVSSAARLYTIEPTTGVVTEVATLRAASGDAFTTLNGTDFGVDFNPVADRLRVVSNTGQNLRINVETGDTITDGSITPPAGRTSAITAVAYTNSFAGTTSTALYDIDAAAGLLHLQDPPNAGGLAAGVPLGVTAGSVNGFDVDARNNTGYAALTVGSATALYRVDLTTTAGGTAATRIGDIAGGEVVRGLALVQAAAPTVIGLTNDNRLVAFDPKAPTTLTSTVAITGLQAGESVLGIDVRPANGQLYALTNRARIYTVNPANGAATVSSTLSADPSDTTLPYAGLTGSLFSVDFNPAADRLRVLSETGQNLRINVETGATTTDGVVNRATPARVLGAAYSNSFAGTTSTTLYDFEGNSNVLARQVPPNDGTLIGHRPARHSADGPDRHRHRRGWQRARAGGAAKQRCGGFVFALHGVAVDRCAQPVSQHQRRRGAVAHRWRERPSIARHRDPVLRQGRPIGSTGRTRLRRPQHPDHPACCDPGAVIVADGVLLGESEPAVERQRCHVVGPQFQLNRRNARDTGGPGQPLDQPRRHAAVPMRGLHTQQRQVGGLLREMHCGEAV